MSTGVLTFRSSVSSKHGQIASSVFLGLRYVKKRCDLGLKIRFVTFMRRLRQILCVVEDADVLQIGISTVL